MGYFSRFSGVVFVCAALAAATILYGQNCTYQCVEAQECLQADSPCDACIPSFGPFSGAQCSNMTDFEANPAGLVIKQRLSGGTQSATFQDEVICTRTRPCGDGAQDLYQYCQLSTTCDDTSSLYAVCKRCQPEGLWINATYDDYHCEECE